MTNMKKILVTGGTGFIGRYVVEDLLRRGYRPVVLDRKSHIPTEDYESILGDIRDSVCVTEAMAQCDGWVHLAAVLGTQETINNPRPAAMSNLEGGLNILEAASQYNLPGSYISVGNHWMNNTYSITKNMLERFIAMYNTDRDTKINIVRAVNAYGPRQIPVAPWGSSKVRKITPSFICRALSNQDLEVYGGGHQISDMVWVGDVAKALVSALEKANQGIVFNKAVEVGPAISNTVREVAELIIELTDSKSKIVDLPMRPGEIPGDKVSADINTLSLVDMEASELMDLRSGMLKTIEHFRSTYF